MRLTRNAVMGSLWLAACAGASDPQSTESSESGLSTAQLQLAAAGSGVAGVAAPSTAGAAAPTPGASEVGVRPVLGCDGASLLETASSDLALRGPWPVGERTVQIGRINAVEVFYPATPRSEVGQTPVQFDLRSFLPQSEQSKVPDSEATQLSANTYRDLPLDEGHGPYPAVIFVHGTGSFRVSSLSTLALWASRGFIVVAADHPGLYLTDYLAANGCGQLAPLADVNSDVDAELQALGQAQGPLGFLAGRVDLQRVGLSGHSSGAVAVAGFSNKPGVQVVIPLAGTRAVSGSRSLRSVLFVGGLGDTVLPYAPGGFGVGSVLYPGSITGAYQSTSNFGPLTKRLVGLREAGHLNLTDMCQPNLLGQPSIEAARSHGVCGADSVAQLANCGAVDRANASLVVNTVTSAVLEETLQCRDRSATIAALPSRYADIADYQQEPQ